MPTKYEVDQVLDALEKRDAVVNTALAELKKHRQEHADTLLHIQQQLAGNEHHATLSSGAGGGRHAALQALTKSHEAALGELANARGRVTLRSQTPVAIKALTSLVNGGDSPPSGYPVGAVRDPTIFTPPPRALTLLDVLEAFRCAPVPHTNSCSSPKRRTHHWPRTAARTIKSARVM
jgi:hypothetical protein